MQVFKQGASVVIGSRKIENGEAVRAELDKQDFSRFHVFQLDLEDFSSIQAFAAKIEENFAGVHVLVNNAGVMNTSFSRTKQGHEIQMGVNHLGPFVLTQLLTDILGRTGTREKPARVINTSSCVATQILVRGTKIHMDWDDFNWETRKYDGWIAYGQSKLANVLHAMELNNRYIRESRNIVAVSLHPGSVRTNLTRHTIPSCVNSLVNGFLKLAIRQIGVWEGSQTTLHCVLGDIIGGAFYSLSQSPRGCYPAEVLEFIGWPCTKYPNPEMTENNARKLWEVSEKMVGMQVDSS